MPSQSLEVFPSLGFKTLNGVIMSISDVLVVLGNLRNEYPVILLCVVITFLKGPNYSILTEINMFGFNYSSLDVSVEVLLHHHSTHYTNPVNKPGHNHWIQVVDEKCGVGCKVEGY